MLFDQLYILVMLLIALSIASERLVEITKAFIPGLTQKFDNNPRKEKLRQVGVQGLSVVAGIITAYLAEGILPTEVASKMNAVSTIGLGLLASGGSSFWNSILSYLIKVKDIKQVKSEAIKGLVSVGLPNVPPAPNAVLPIPALENNGNNSIQLNL